MPTRTTTGGWGFLPLTKSFRFGRPTYRFRSRETVRGGYGGLGVPGGNVRGSPGFRGVRGETVTLFGSGGGGNRGVTYLNRLTGDPGFFYRGVLRVLKPPFFTPGKTRENPGGGVTGGYPPFYPRVKKPPP
jgi:hypothetical protein